MRIYVVFLTLVSSCLCGLQFYQQIDPIPVDFGFQTYHDAAPLYMGAKGDLVWKVHQWTDSMALQIFRYDNVTANYTNIFSGSVTGPDYPNNDQFMNMDYMDGWVSVVSHWSEKSYWRGYFLWAMIQLDSNFTVLNVQFLNATEEPFEQGRFLPDGSFLAISNNWLKTYKLNGTNWTAVNKFVFPVTFPVVMLNTRPMEYLSAPYYLGFALQGNQFLCFDSSSNMFIFERLSNDSWTLKEDATGFNTTYLTAVAWNGDDAVLITRGAMSTQFGPFDVATRQSDGVWKIVSTSETDVGFYLNTPIGPAVYSFDKNTFLVSATKSYYVSPYYGSVLVIQRQPGNDTWYLNGNFTNPFGGSMGDAIAANDHHVIVSVANNQTVTFPLCRVMPIEVDCDGSRLSSCNFTEFDPSMVCTPHPVCPWTSHRVTDSSVHDNKITVQFVLQRNGAFDLPVNITITCNGNGGPGSSSPISDTPSSLSPSTPYNSPSSGTPSSSSPTSVDHNSPTNHLTSNAIVVSRVASLAVVLIACITWIMLL